MKLSSRFPTGVVWSSSFGSYDGPPTRFGTSSTGTGPPVGAAISTPSNCPTWLSCVGELDRVVGKSLQAGTFHVGRVPEQPATLRTGARGCGPFESIPAVLTHVHRCPGRIGHGVCSAPDVDTPSITLFPDTAVNCTLVGYGATAEYADTEVVSKSRTSDTPARPHAPLGTRSPRCGYSRVTTHAPTYREPNKGGPAVPVPSVSVAPCGRWLQRSRPGRGVGPSDRRIRVAPRGRSGTAGVTRTGITLRGIDGRHRPPTRRGRVSRRRVGTPGEGR
jgi:hypothetical protein